MTNHLIGSLLTLILELITLFGLLSGVILISVILLSFILAVL